MAKTSFPCYKNASIIIEEKLKYLKTSISHIYVILKRFHRLILVYGVFYGYQIDNRNDDNRIYEYVPECILLISRRCYEFLY